MQVNWIKGSIAPGQDGDFYAILEALTDVWQDGELYCKEGKLAMGVSTWSASEGGFPCTSGEHPIWRVLAWAPVILPDVPREDRPRLWRYFGERVRITDGGTWLTGDAAKKEDNIKEECNNGSMD